MVVGRWFIALAMLALVFSSRAETLLVFGDSVYAPVVYADRGQPAGVLPAILKRLERDTGDVYQLQLFPWRRAYENATRGEGGLIGVSFTRERAALFDFSRPIYDDDIQLVTLADKKFWFAGLGDLKGKVLGGVQGASYGDEVDKAIAAGLFTVDRDVGQVGRLRKLLAGRLDAALVGNGQAGFDAIILADDVLRSKRDQFAILKPPLVRDPLHLAFPKRMGKKAALERFDQALLRLQKSAEWKTLTTPPVPASDRAK